ncbi:DUF3800 domain-containing protein [Prosthecobacter vanneervenii]|uniref:DUF3800 domain-containing protein n=1 Tax=Prosthecobacter vanneervenii TaxID=48466 RepID=A0A7W8DN64_9BACT|nr:DUF3800 domain-containing protein [Prosthecobacter vanneervenii]MBB5035571.1 hypothetical protein [Prosthecobacter vanneervenii]
MSDAKTDKDLCHLYVDEAGTPDIFDAKGRNNIGQQGCSRFFFLGMLEVHEPDKLIEALRNLREQMVADPYFASAESFKPERRKTALLLHAKDDLPEVRVKVFDLLRSMGSALRFRAVVCDKEVIRLREEKKREEAPGYRYNPDHLYDELARSVLGKFSRMADGYRLWIAKRGSKDRNAALRTALEHAEADFERSFGFSRGGADAWHTTVTNPRETVCLQAADYFLWALQRFYEPRVHAQTGEVTHEERYLNAVWPQISQIHDLHFGREHGTFFTPSNPLTLEARFGPKPQKKKKPHV